MHTFCRHSTSQTHTRIGFDENDTHASDSETSVVDDELDLEGSNFLTFLDDTCSKKVRPHEICSFPPPSLFCYLIPSNTHGPTCDIRTTINAQAQMERKKTFLADKDFLGRHIPSFRSEDLELSSSTRLMPIAGIIQVANWGLQVYIQSERTLECLRVSNMNVKRAALIRMYRV